MEFQELRNTEHNDRVGVEFVQLTRELIKSTCGRAYWYTQEYEYCCNTDMSSIEHLKVWRGDDNDRIKKPIKIKPIPEPYHTNLLALVKIMSSTPIGEPKTIH